MTWDDLVLISPLLAGILTAAAILIVDLIRPGKTAVAVAVALIGLSDHGRAGGARRTDARGSRSAAPTRSTP